MISFFSGYGHIYPLTLTGKIFTIFYSLMALGVFFAILANIGNALANGLTFLYSRICCRCFRIQRVKSEIPSRVMRKKLRRRLVGIPFSSLNKVIRRHLVK